VLAYLKSDLKRGVIQLDAEIRALTVDDRAAWLPLWQGYQAFYKVDIADPVTNRTWSRMLDPAEPVHGALALLDGKAVGLVHWLFHRSTWSVVDLCYLQDLFVAPETRGRGAGVALIAHVYEQARTAGCAEVYWLTHETNTTAMKLYDRVAKRDGFVQYSKTLA
jgi:GNAT superfamily N-acetyltransferase